MGLKSSSMTTKTRATEQNFAEVLFEVKRNGISQLLVSKVI